MFDLTVVVAVARAALWLHHDIAVRHYGQALDDLLFSFFTVWWSWMSFAWVSSTYDTDDIPNRLVSVVQVVGVLIMALGLGQEVAGQLTATLGYTLTRAALVALWQVPLRTGSAHLAGSVAAARPRSAGGVGSTVVCRARRAGVGSSGLG